MVSHTKNHRKTLDDFKVYDPIGSMYGIFAYIYHKNQLYVGEYTIHGWYGDGFPLPPQRRNPRPMISQMNLKGCGILWSELNLVDSLIHPWICWFFVGGWCWRFLSQYWPTWLNFLGDDKYLGGKMDFIPYLHGPKWLSKFMDCSIPDHHLRVNIVWVHVFQAFPHRKSKQLHFQVSQWWRNLSGISSVVVAMTFISTFRQKIEEDYPVDH